LLHDDSENQSPDQKNRSTTTTSTTDAQLHAHLSLSELSSAKAWMYVTRADEPEPLSRERLQYINDELFGKKMIPKLGDSIDQLAAIVVQMAAHRYADD